MSYIFLFLLNLQPATIAVEQSTHQPTGITELQAKLKAELKTSTNEEEEEEKKKKAAKKTEEEEMKKKKSPPPKEAEKKKKSCCVLS